MSSKTCRKCGAQKSPDEFNRQSKTADGKHPYCKTCARLATREAALSRKFNVTPSQYEMMLAAQGGGCAICGKTPEENGKRLAVDHDHACCPSISESCGLCVRALLCSRCNSVLGYFNDDVDLVGNALAYLLEWEAERESRAEMVQ